MGTVWHGLTPLKNQKPKKTDPTGQTKTKRGMCFFGAFGFLKNQKPKPKFWFLVFLVGSDFFVFLVFGLVPGVCIVLLVGFWFFAGGVATYISSSSYKRTLQKPSLVPHLPYKRTLQKPCAIKGFHSPLSLVTA